MKKFGLISFVILASLILGGCAAAPVAGFVALPDTTKVAIDGLLILGVSLALQFAISRIQFLSFLAPYSKEWGLGLSALVIPWLENLLPGGLFAEASTLGVQAVLALISGWLASNKFLGSKGVKGFTE